jgi:signal transduction histidine kinase
MINGLIDPITLRQKDYLGEVLDSAEHLLSLINMILDRSKIESGQFEIKEAIINPLHLVEHVCNRQQMLADKKNLKLDCIIERSLPESIWGDELRIKQVLINLVNNGIKFTKVGSVVIRAWADDTFWYVEIKDTGIGISTEDQKRLFHEFIQLDSSISREYEGTGLGLAISSKILTMMGGGIKLESEPGQGSTFTAHIPLKVANLEGYDYNF